MTDSTKPDPEEPIEARLWAKAAGDLGWEDLLERIARFCVGTVAADAVREIVPARTAEEARSRTRRVAETLRLTEQGESLPVVEIDDLTEMVERVRRGAVASGGELRDLSRLLRAAGELRRFVDRHAELAPTLARVLSCDPPLDELLSELDCAIEPEGTVSDEASTELREARRRAAEARRQLTRRLGELLNRYNDVLRDRYYAERDGRYVLPVRSDAHFRVPGIVLGASSSGGTLYVEPHEVTGLANDLTLQLAEVDREEHRVLARLSGAARDHADAILAAQDAAVLADVSSAIARWAGETRAHPIEPSDDAEIVLYNVRHPLLIGRETEVVPNDIELAAGTALIISGPNAGGKTVALKSLGLVAWMVRAGLPVPAAAESRVGWFEAVLTDVGDEQSLAMSLSTFSAHVDNVARIVRRAGSATLVLLDELAGGTDPEEGAALATAVLEALVDANAAVATTTHYERLKEAAAEHDRFRNASVGFDLDAMAPTFRLVLDVPGPSSALAVAQRFGFPSSIVERARSLLPEQAVAREDLISQLFREREALQQARFDAQRDAEEQSRLKQSLAAERATARQKERARLAREAEALMGSVRQARARLHEVEQRLRRPGLQSEELVELEKMVDGAARPVAVGSELSRVARGDEEERSALTADELQPGMSVHLSKLDRQAEVVEVTSKGMVRVLAGPLKMLVPPDELRRSSGSPTRPRPRNKRGSPPRARARETTGVDGFVPVRAADNTLDLRGQRVEEALDAVDVFFDRLLNRGERVGYVLHGHGTGALKAAVREHLRGSRYVSKSGPAEPDDGGDAFTVAWLGN